ncbi:hypothetical protein O181_023265 [Austropuccinia psidii MF-1]|uniref:Integrase catalytic domain-containing protein n=1 Tax=Austropuccinia psidii MF-1 TaxID=1389203 RepID=A0A9Q3GYX4_9BASI|nr:hypothetical protein [Austropuccinia psidii MF-1]
MSEERKMERIKTCSWWPSWRKDVIEYFQSCDRFQKANKATEKRFGWMIHIQEPSTPWEVVHIDEVTALPPGGDKSYNVFLVIVDRYSKTPIFLPCRKDDTDMDTALLIWNRVISHTVLLKISLVIETQNLHQTYGKIYISFLVKKLSFSTACHPQTEGSAERIIQTLGEIIRRFCAYGL